MEDDDQSFDNEEEEETDNEYNSEEKEENVNEYNRDEEEDDDNGDNNEEEEKEGNNEEEEKRNNDKEERNDNEEEEIHQIVEALDEDKIPFCNVSSQILTVLLDHFEGDILMVGPFLFRFFQISFACGILKIGFGYSNRTFVILSLFGREILASGFEPF
ncbi:unnamed protein product [Rhizophagus irregularis]|nr:unnamed protein product [Rhizophagus irregularis]